MSLKVANTIVLTDDLRGRFSNTVFTNGAYLVMPEDPSVEYQFQGTISSYISGGRASTPPTGESNVIEKFNFSDTTTASDIGDLTVARRSLSGQSSSSSGYASGGFVDPGTAQNVIDKFPFAVDTNASDVGDLSQARQTLNSGQSSETNGYACCGDEAPGFNNEIDRFPFASDNNSTIIGNAGTARNGSSGISSRVSGYISGGYSTPPQTFYDIIEKFPFSAETNAGDVGDLTETKNALAGISSETFGYNAGGISPTSPPPSPLTKVIEKFPFASDSDSVSVGELTIEKYSPVGTSSVTDGFATGGATPTKITTIESFPFATDTNATDVGDITVARDLATGQQR